MLLCTVGASLLGTLLTGRRAIKKSQGRETYRAGKGKGINRAEEGIVRAGYGFSIPPHPFNFDMQNIIKMNPDLMAFIREIIYPK